MKFVRDSRLYTKVDSCTLPKGAEVLVKKGAPDLPNVRSRLVAKRVKKYEALDLFAATPPLEALAMLVAKAASRGWGMFHIDV